MPTRRTFGKAAGSIALGGVGLYAIASEPAQALEVTNIDIQDAEYESDSGELYTPWLDCIADYTYRVNDDPTEVRALLMIGPPENRDVVDMVSQPVAMREGSGSIETAAPVVDSPQFDSAMFDVANPGESVTVDVPFANRLQVRNSSGTLIQRTAEATVAVTVTHTGAEPTVDMTVVGSVAFQASEGDPAPF